MNEKSKLQASLSRLLGKESTASSPYAWLATKTAREGRLDLSHAGEEKYVSAILDVRQQDEEAVVIADQLIPQPNEAFWNQTVSLTCKLNAFKDGMEYIANFRALVGEQVQAKGHHGIELTNLADYERKSQEYVATVPPANPVGLSFVWMGEWVDVKPKRMTITRFFFDAELQGFRSPDGYSISQAMLKLEAGGKAQQVRLKLMRGLNGEFEAELTRIDTEARQKLTTLIEEIWRTDAGLSSRRSPRTESDVGFMKRQELGNGPHIVLLSDDEEMKETLGELGTVIMTADTSLKSLSQTVSESPSDLFIADADLWGQKAVAVERLLRSVSRYRKIPRLWFTRHDLGQPWEESDFHLGSNEDDPEIEFHAMDRDVHLDHVDYGAFDLMPRSLPADELMQRLRWAMNENSFGDGTGILLVTQDTRLRYRIGLAFLEEAVRFSIFKRLHGLTPAIEQRKPKWVLLDASSFEVEIDPMLAGVREWTDSNRGHVIVLVKAAEHKRVAQWLHSGARDVVLLDPSLRVAMRRLRKRILGTE